MMGMPKMIRARQGNLLIDNGRRRLIQTYDFEIGQGTNINAKIIDLAQHHTLSLKVKS
jgi:hypothetical protein